jgi:hypothetical protein
VQDPEKAFICSMFHTLGRYLTIYYLPEEHQEITHIMRRKGADEATACRSVLGLTYEELGIGVAREWHLPQEIVASMRPLPPGPVGKAETEAEKLRALAAFSNETFQILSDAEEKNPDAALRSLRQRFDDSVPVDKDGLLKAVKSAVEDLDVYGNADALQDTRILRGAGSWVDNHEGRQATAPAGAKRAPDSEPGPEKTATASQDPHTTLLNGIQDISHAILDNYRLNDILVMVLETIFRGMGFTRVVLLVKHAPTHRMVARFGLGQDIDTVLNRFRFHPDRGRDLFTRAVNEQSDAVCNQAATSPDTPEWYRGLVPAQAFALFPIVVNRICVGLIYADQEDAARPISDADANFLNTLRNQAALAVKQHS